jgi:hypothetical protein
LLLDVKQRLEFFLCPSISVAVIGGFIAHV